MGLTLALFKYTGAHTAAKVLQQLREGLLASAPWSAEIGLLERHRHGRVSMRATVNGAYFEETEGATPAVATALGALTGAVLGLVTGPGAIAGAVAGGVAGGTLGKIDELSREETIFDDIRRELERDTSALMLLAEVDLVDTLERAVEGTGAHVARREVSDSLLERLERLSRP